MSDLFNRVFAFTVGQEGSDLDKVWGDRGNWTGGLIGAGELRGSRFGISAAAYPDVDIADLTLDQARDIYARDYWAPIRGDELPGPIALMVFDAAVNSGVGMAARWLQRAVGAVDDGVIGAKTIAATVATVKAKGGAALCIELLSQRLAFMTANPANWERFGASGGRPLGWTRRLFSLAYQSVAFT